jgi:hypothetical protein
MTKSELIKKLEEYSDDWKIVFTHIPNGKKPAYEDIILENIHARKIYPYFQHRNLPASYHNVDKEYLDYMQSSGQKDESVSAIILG